jgi:hypothetical protein
VDLPVARCFIGTGAVGQRREPSSSPGPPIASKSAFWRPTSTFGPDSRRVSLDWETEGPNYALHTLLLPNPRSIAPTNVRSFHERIDNGMEGTMREPVTLRAAFCMVIMLLPLASAAEPITITFDDRAPGFQAPLAYVEDGLIAYSGLGSFPGPLLTTFTGWGISAHPAATTPPQVGFGSTTGAQGPLPHFLGTFTVPGSDVQAYTSLLSFDVVGTEPGQISPWFAAIYADNFNLLGWQTGTTDTRVTFLNPGIRQFILFSSPGLEAIDTVTFETPVVPEPTSMLLLGTGLGVLAVRRLRRRQT